MSAVEVHVAGGRHEAGGENDRSDLPNPFARHTLEVIERRMGHNLLSTPTSAIKLVRLSQSLPGRVGRTQYSRCRLLSDIPKPGSVQIALVN